jgi:hypothetical protein
MTRIYRAPAGDQSPQVTARLPTTIVTVFVGCGAPQPPDRRARHTSSSEARSTAAQSAREAKRRGHHQLHPFPSQNSKPFTRGPSRLRTACPIATSGPLVQKHLRDDHYRRLTGYPINMAQRLTTRLVRSLIRPGAIPISALLLGATSTTVGLLASAPQASARQTQVSVVSCNNVIASTRKPDSEERVVLGSFGAPPPRIQRAANGQGNGWQYFAKTGVQVEAGSLPVTVSVAPAFRHRAAISWGNAQPIVQTVRFASCRATATRWDAYAGGFFLRSRTACIPLVVRIGSRSKTVRVGIGKSCT